MSVCRDAYLFFNVARRRLLGIANISLWKNDIRHDDFLIARTLKLITTACVAKLLYVLIWIIIRQQLMSQTVWD